MIQAIIHYPNKELLNEVFSQTGLMPVAIGGMKEGHYSVLGLPEQAVALEEYLNVGEDKVGYIGCWNLNGTIYLWEGEDSEHRNYSPQKYLDALRDYTDKDEDGNVIEGSERVPTMEEAMVHHVSKVSGCPNRVLITEEPKEE